MTDAIQFAGALEHRAQCFARLLPFADFFLQIAVQPFQLLGALGHALFQLSVQEVDLLFGLAAFGDFISEAGIGRFDLQARVVTRCSNSALSRCASAYSKALSSASAARRARSSASARSIGV